MLGALLSVEGRRVTAHFGGTLSIIYSAESINARPTSRPVGIMPLLVILFIVSYGILTMLVFEQGQTIESQRSLIKEMLKDSTQLAAIKDKLAREDGKRMQSKGSEQAEQKTPDAANATSGAKPSDKAVKRPGKTARSTQVPGKPAGDLEDVRRSTRII